MSRFLSHLPTWVIPTTDDQMHRRLLQLIIALLLGGLLQLLLWIV